MEIFVWGLGGKRGELEVDLRLLLAWIPADNGNKVKAKERWKGEQLRGIDVILNYFKTLITRGTILWVGDMPHFF